MLGKFKILNASAGSGKTRQLVKEYLRVIFSSDRLDQYQKILAITFTNKATFEMKRRIVSELTWLSSAEQLSGIGQELSQEMGLDSGQISQKADAVLQHMAHNYGRFSIQTIDQFTHGLVRAFSQDLMLPAHFSLELEPRKMLSKVVGEMVEGLKPKDNASNILIDFIERKIGENRSWNIFNILIQQAQSILFEENDYRYYKQLQSVSGQDLSQFKALLLKKKQAIESQKQQLAAEALELIKTNALVDAGLNKNVLGVFKKFAETNKYSIIFNTKISQNFEQMDLCLKGADSPETVRSFLPELISIFQTLRSLIVDYKPYLLELFLKNYNVLELLYEVQLRLSRYKKQHKTVPLIELNQIIAENIKGYDAPYIYEKLGQRYQNFFIDEFQDTSKFQWENLIPLVQEAVDHSSGQLLIVGDAKQAIYRWRGGVAEQFIDLYQKKSQPFQTDQQIQLMPKNYRSSPTVVDFCNDFFTINCSVFFQNPSYEQLYRDTCNQQPHHQMEGEVKIHFSDFSGIRLQQQQQAILCEAMYSTILEIQSKGYPLSEITVLTRKNKELKQVSDFLEEKGIPVVSFELLKLDDAPEVLFLVNALTVLADPGNRYAKLQLFHFLNTHYGEANDIHDGYKRGLESRDLEVFFREAYGLSTEWNQLLNLDVFQMVSNLVSDFGLDSHNGYVGGFLDLVLTFLHQEQANGVSYFLSYWEEHDKTIKQNTNTSDFNAINLMTIHASKGLEFPFVLVPFLDYTIGVLNAKQDAAWVPVLEDTSIENIKIPLDKDLEVIYPQLYQDAQTKRELDDVNTLYVALTRAEKGLYILSEEPRDTDSGERKLSRFLKDFLQAKNLWQEEQQEYRFGSIPVCAESYCEEIEETPVVEQEQPDYAERIKFGLVLPKEPNRGDVVHKLFANVYTQADIETLLSDSWTRDYLTESNVPFDFFERNLKQLLKINSSFFQTQTHEVLNERDIIYNQSVLRPDRVVLNLSEQSVVIYDYKTGRARPDYSEQMTHYKQAYASMGYVVKESYLVYLQDEGLRLQAV